MNTPPQPLLQHTTAVPSVSFCTLLLPFFWETRTNSMSATIRCFNRMETQCGNANALPILGWKAMGFLSKHDLMALDRSSSCSRLLAQLLQLQLWQNSPLAKQSQYLQRASLLSQCCTTFQGYELPHFVNRQPFIIQIFNFLEIVVHELWLELSMSSKIYAWYCERTTFSEYQHARWHKCRHALRFICVDKRAKTMQTYAKWSEWRWCSWPVNKSINNANSIHLTHNLFIINSSPHLWKQFCFN